MGRIEIEEFTDKEISRIFIADLIKTTEKAEDILTKNNVDYAVSLEPFIEMLAIAECNGIAFYVLSGQADYCRKLLASKGLSSGLTIEETL